MSFIMRTKSAFEEEEKRKDIFETHVLLKSFMCMCVYNEDTRSGKPLSTRVL